MSKKDQQNPRGISAGSEKKSKLSFKERLEAFKNLPRFFKMIWETSRSMTLGNMLLRVIKAAIPVVMLWVGKLLIDEIILQIDNPVPDFSLIWIYLVMEFGLAIISDLINRGINLLDSQLGDLFSNKTSV